MAKNHVYHVIGGQYRSINYGSFDTLRKAMLCATRNLEFHDNWVGWVKPEIYVDDNSYPSYVFEKTKWVQLY